MIVKNVVMDIGYAASGHWQTCLWHDDTCFKTLFLLQPVPLMHVFTESFTFGH